jgi:predicted nucleic acid-binding protein
VAVTRYLADKSALARLHLPAVREELEPLIIRALVGICGVTELEMLFSARNIQERARMKEQLAASLDQVDTPADIWDQAAEIQEALTEQAQHRSASIPDLIVAATARARGLEILHYDRDFDTIARYTEQPARWIVPPGTVLSPPYSRFAEGGRQGLEGGDGVGQRLLAEGLGQPGGRGRMAGAYPGDRGTAFVGRGEQLGPAVRRVGEVPGQPAFGQDVRDALDALPGDAHVPRDAGHGQRLAQDRAEHLPPRRGQPGRPGQFLGEREKLAVQLERRDRRRGQQVPLAACHAGALVSPGAGTAISS